MLLRQQLHLRGLPMQPGMRVPAIMDLNTVEVPADSVPQAPKSSVEGIAIKGGQLKAVRRARKIGRPKLAKLSGISERQIAKIEGSCAPLLSQELLFRFSHALSVPVPVLTGDEAPLDTDLQVLPADKPSCSCCG